MKIFSDFLFFAVTGLSNCCSKSDLTTVAQTRNHSRLVLSFSYLFQNETFQNVKYSHTRGVIKSESLWQVARQIGECNVVQLSRSLKHPNSVLIFETETVPLIWVLLQGST